MIGDNSRQLQNLLSHQLTHFFTALSLGSILRRGTMFYNIAYTVNKELDEVHPKLLGCLSV